MASVTNSSADLNSFYVQQGGGTISTADIENRITRGKKPVLQRADPQAGKAYDTALGAQRSIKPKLERGIWAMIKSYTRAYGGSGATIAANSTAQEIAHRGISMIGTPYDNNYAIYLARSSGQSWSGGTPCSPDGITSWAIRQRVQTTDAAGFILENVSEQALMSVTGSSGNLTTKGSITAGSTVKVGSSQRVEFGTSAGIPSTAAGSRLRLYPSGTSPSLSDYSIGVTSGATWFNVPTGSQYLWYNQGVVSALLSPDAIFYCSGVKNPRGAEVIPVGVDYSYTGSTSGSDDYQEVGVGFVAVSTNTTVQLMGWGRITSGSGNDTAGIKVYLRYSGSSKLQPSNWQGHIYRANADDDAYSPNFCIQATLTTVVGVTYYGGLCVGATGSDDLFAITVSGATVFQGPD